MVFIPLSEASLAKDFSFLVVCNIKILEYNSVNLLSGLIADSAKKKFSVRNKKNSAKYYSIEKKGK